MARLDEYVFGYARGKVEKQNVTKLANVFLRANIGASVYSDGSFTVREKDRKRFSTFARAKMRFELGEPLGLYGFLLRNKSKYGIFAAIAVLLSIFLFCRNLVWDVRIEGTEKLSVSAVEQGLEELGFGVGSSWRRIDKNAIETGILSSHSEIAWISLNRRGTVAYVEIIESENIGLTEDIGPQYSNLIADRDGVIEEITVKSGQATVKIGDVVKKGDILISGVTESEAGVTLCRAQGFVRARSAASVSTEVSRNVGEKTLKKERIAELRIIIFNFSINIFKNYRNCGETCDIIEEIEEFALFGKYRLPVKLRKTRVREYTECTRTRTEDEMINVAKRELDDRINTEFFDADVLMLRTDGEFRDDVFRLTTRVVYVTDICKESAIEIN